MIDIDTARELMPLFVNHNITATYVNDRDFPGHFRVQINSFESFFDLEYVAGVLNLGLSYDAQGGSDAWEVWKKGSGLPPHPKARRSQEDRSGAAAHEPPQDEQQTTSLTPAQEAYFADEREPRFPYDEERPRRAAPRSGDDEPSVPRGKVWTPGQWAETQMLDEPRDSGKQST